MSFGKIGSWIDNKLNNVGTSWRGSTARKTVDSIMERSRQTTGEIKDSIGEKTETIRDNIDAGLTRIEKENPDATGFQKFMEIGKRGGLIGLAMKGDGQKTESTPPPLPKEPPVIEQKQPEPQQLELFDETTRGSTGITLEQALKNSDAGLIILDPGKGTITHLNPPDDMPEKPAVTQQESGGFLKKAWDFGKQGGLVGYLNRKKETQEPFVPTNARPMEHVDGYNIAN